MFDYEKFENDLVQQMELILSQWAKAHDDLYIFSLDCARGMDSIGAAANSGVYLAAQAEPGEEDYYYYKYCEEEWDLFYPFERISEGMRGYIDENDADFTDPQTLKYTKAFDQHCVKMIECCKNSLVRLRQSISPSNTGLLLAFNIREYLDEEERIEIFKSINSADAWTEYAAHIEEFG